MTEHTKEPWIVTGEDPDDGSRTKDGTWPLVITEARKPRTGETLLWLAHGIQREEDARRIVACVNACAGIPDKNLTPEIFGQMRGALRFILAFYEPGQTYLDTNAWKHAEASGRAALAKAGG